MKYALLIYHGDPRDSVSQPDMDKWMREIEAHNAAMRRAGTFVMTTGLGFPDTATLVRNRDGKVSMTDGPFTETREYLGGIYIIEAPDLDRALKEAADLPMARFGTIEVRPLNTFIT
jgi:hypothetical protein